MNKEMNNNTVAHCNENCQNATESQQFLADCDFSTYCTFCSA